jgi:alkylglycerol monooxygenase
MEQIDIFFILVNTSILSLLVFEFSYSLWKKDGKYKIWGTFGNTLREVVGWIPGNASVAITLYLAYAFLPETTTSTNLSLISFIACLIIVDFTYYFFHLAHHTFGILRSFHFVHHSDTSFNLTTSFRLPWIGGIYTSVILMLPALLLGFNFKVVLYALLTVGLYQFFTHSAYIKLPKILTYILVTPKTHSIHHDQVELNQRSNLSAMFSVWDRLFGTYVSDIKEFTPGIKGYSQDNFIMMEVDPIVRYLKNR